MARAGRRGRHRVADARAPREPHGCPGAAPGSRRRLTATGRAIRRPERLTGERAVLRPLAHRDVAPFASAFGDDAQLGQLLGFDRDPGEDYVRERLRDERRKLREGRAVAFAIAEPETGEFRGEVLLHTFEWQHARAAVGIWIRAEWRGQGRGSCALRLICAYGFEELGLRRLEMTTFPSNQATIRMAERVGFRREGVLRSYTSERGRRRDLTMLSLLPGELR